MREKFEYLLRVKLEEKKLNLYWKCKVTFILKRREYDAKYGSTTLYKEFSHLKVTILIPISMFSTIIYDAKYGVTILYFIVANKDGLMGLGSSPFIKINEDCHLKKKYKI